MSREFTKLAVPVVIVGLVMAGVADGLFCLIPLIAVGFVIRSLFHAAKGFERADRKRRKRY